MNLESYVPTIDLRSQQSNSLELQAQAIRHACEETGFFAVSDHGVSTTVMGDCLKAAHLFFKQPIKEKNKVRQSSPESPYGFIPMAQETLGRSRGVETPPDLKESFSIGPSVRARPPKNSEEARRRIARMKSQKFPISKLPTMESNGQSSSPNLGAEPFIESMETPKSSMPDPLISKQTIEIITEPKLGTKSEAMQQVNEFPEGEPALDPEPILLDEKPVIEKMQEKP